MQYTQKEISEMAKSNKDKEVEAFNNGVTLADSMTTHADNWLIAIDADISSSASKVKTNASFGQYLDSSNYIFPLVDAKITTTAEAENDLFDKWFETYGKFFGGEKSKQAIKTQWKRVRQLMRTLRQSHADGKSKAPFTSELQTLKRNTKYYIKTGQTEGAKKRCNKKDADKKKSAAMKKAAPKPKAFKVTSGNCKDTVKRILANLKAEKIRLEALRAWTVEKNQDPEHIMGTQVDSLAAIMVAVKALPIKKA